MVTLITNDNLAFTKSKCGIYVNKKIKNTQSLNKTRKHKTRKNKTRKNKTRKNKTRN